MTADERVYYRDGPPRLVQVMPYTPEPPPAALAEEHQALQNAERDCLQVCLFACALFALWLSHNNTGFVSCNNQLALLISRNTQVNQSP